MLLELRDAVLEHHLLVLRVVVLCVLGDLAELARRGDALRDLAPLVRPEPPIVALQLLVALGVRMTSFTKTPPETESRGPRPRQRPGMVATADDARQPPRLALPAA